MRETTLKIAFVIGLVLIIQSCYSDYPPESVLPNPDNISFNRDVLPILAKSCGIAQCHDGSKQPDLRADFAYGNVSYAYRDLVIGNPNSTPKWKTYINTTFPDESSLIAAILYGVGSLPMPPDGSMPQEDVNLIRAWMLKGAPND